MKNILNKIFLGDSIELLPHILEKVDREKVILVSDPPFNVNYHYNTYKDNLDEEEYFEIAKDRLNGINPKGQTSIYTDFNKV